MLAAIVGTQASVILEVYKSVGGVRSGVLSCTYILTSYHISTLNVACI